MGIHLVKSYVLTVFKAINLEWLSSLKVLRLTYFTRDEFNYKVSLSSFLLVTRIA